MQACWQLQNIQRYPEAWCWWMVPGNLRKSKQQLKGWLRQEVFQKPQDQQFKRWDIPLPCMLRKYLPQSGTIWIAAFFVALSWRIWCKSFDMLLGHWTCESMLFSSSKFTASKFELSYQRPLAGCWSREQYAGQADQLFCASSSQNRAQYQQ